MDKIMSEQADNNQAAEAEDFKYLTVVAKELGYDTAYRALEDLKRIKTYGDSDNRVHITLTVEQANKLIDSIGLLAKLR